MGSAASKDLVAGKGSDSTEDVQSDSIPTTPILTPEPRKKISELDPRSPNAYISRTPLQLLSSTTEQLELNDEELFDLNGKICTKSKTVLLELDPRSPTTDFKRTPIVICVNPESNVPKKIHNKNLDKVRRSTIATTPKSIGDNKPSSNVIPPKLLDSSPVKLTSGFSKRKSFIGLLETNIDFTETDLDAVIREKSRIGENIENDFNMASSKTRVDIINKNIDPRSPSTDFVRTPIKINRDDEKMYTNVNCETEPTQVVEWQDNVTLDKEIENIVQNMCEIIDVENETANTSLVEGFKSVESTEETKLETEDEIICTTDLNIVKETKSAPVSPPTRPISKKDITISKQQSSILPDSPIPKQSKSAPVTPPVVNITADVNELDKKLSNLIYQDEDIDEDIVVCPRIVKLKHNSNRSPLRNCNGTENDRKKSIQKLRVSDKPRKSDYAVSKIPVFKEKGKVAVHCENTPPRNIEKKRAAGKKSHWDNADKTLLI